MTRFFLQGARGKPGVQGSEGEKGEKVCTILSPLSELYYCLVFPAGQLISFIGDGFCRAIHAPNGSNVNKLL